MSSNPTDWSVEWCVSTDPRWDILVTTASNACFLHSEEFLSYHGNRFDEQTALVLSDRLGPVAGLRLVADGSTANSHPGATFGGVLVRSGLRPPEVLHAFHLVSSAVRDAGISRLRMRPMPTRLRPSEDEADLYALHRIGARVVRRELSTIVSLERPLRYSHGRRQQILKANRAGTQVRAVTNSSEFHALMAAALSRHDVSPVHSADELDQLLRRFPSSIKLFVANLGGVGLVAGAVVFDFGRAVHTQYLAASDEGRKCGALDLVIDHLLTVFYADRDVLSFGISTEDGGKVLNEGLVDYKHSFGGRSQVIDTYELFL